MSIRVEIVAVVAPLLLGVLLPVVTPARAAMTLSPGLKRSSSPGDRPAAKPPAAVPSEPIPPTAPTPLVVPTPADGSPAAPSTAASPARPEALSPKKTLEFIGTVIYVKGGRIVAEVKGGAKAKEKFRLYGADFRSRGEVLAVKPLDEVTCLLEPVGSVGVSVSDRLARVGP